MSVERLRKSRKAQRGICTRSVNTIKSQLEAETIEPTVWALIEGNLESLQDRANVLSELDSQIYEAMLDADASDEALEDEIGCVNEYCVSFHEVRALYNARKFKGNEKSKGEDCFSLVTALSSVAEGSHHRYNLPKIEWTKFGGDVQNWLRFWSQFETVDEDENLKPQQKYHYLIQATIPGSRAREIVESFSPTKESYPKAIASLKSRFGREDLLVEHYQRELLKLVVQNIVKKGKVPLSQIYDKLETQINNLETLGVTKDKSAGLLYPLVESCLNEDILRVWQQTPEYRAEPVMEKRLDKLMEFLRCEVEGDMKILAAGSGFGLKEEVQSRKKKEYLIEEDISTAASLISSKQDNRMKQRNSTNVNCIFCEKSHASEHCIFARSLTLDQRVDKLKDSGGCFACLNKHRIAECRTKVICIVCGGRHLPILCKKLDSQKDDKSCESNKSTAIGVLANSTGTVLLRTLTIGLRHNNTFRLARAMIDTGSQRSYVLKGVAAAMALVPCGKERMIHTVFGGSVSSEIKHCRYKLAITDMNNKYAYPIEVLDQTNICGEIPTAAEGTWVQELKAKGIYVSDCGGPIEVLLGADIAGHILTGKKIRLKSGLVAVETHLGWTVMGRVPEVPQIRVSTCSMLSTTMNSISRLWELDILGIEDPSVELNKKELAQAVQQHFLETVFINSEGRYEVHLPWLPNHLPLPSNFSLAKKRLNTVIVKLNKTGYFDRYDQIFEEWQAEGIIEPVPHDQLHIQGHYMPHRPVFRESLTTPIRPVLDASARQTNSPSLNQCLSKGINLLELIPSLMLKFRLQRYGVVSDIRKAFLQISLMERDRNFVRFLWVNREGNLKHFRHARVVFGVTSSPYLLGAVILYHLDRLKIEGRFPVNIIEKLRTSFYCDNCIASVQTKEELDRFIDISSKIFEAGKFQLRGWESTDRTLPPQSLPTSVLGLLWDRRLDVIQIDTKSLKNLNLEGKITKRFMMSIAHKLFDPIGFTAPISLLPKTLLQQVANIKWDDETPSSVGQLFVTWASELPALSQLAIPRWVGSENRSEETWSLHTFVDASREAFGCVCFLKIESHSGSVLRLIQAKSRVVPVDCRHSTPRLELIAALLGARMSFKILSELGNGVTAYYWSDSTTAVAWIRREEEWASFVGNRVKEIRALTKQEAWLHIPGQYNPADLPSRGISVKKFVLSRWWEGPEWLHREEKDWPIRNIVDVEEDEVAREKRKSAVISSSATSTNIQSPPVNPWYNSRFAKFNQNVRVIGWINRFISNCQSKQERNSRRNEDKVELQDNVDVTIPVDQMCPKQNMKINIKVKQLTFDEVELAELTLIRLIQSDHFVGDKDSKIRHLACFYDEKGLLRLKTKISSRVDTNYFRAPLILPGKCELVTKLIWQQHVLNHHVRVQGLLSILRERYWLLFGRNAVKAAIKNCVVCQREAVKRLETPICPLPQFRVEDAPVFATTGVDLAGPLQIKGGQKVWVAIYTCSVYRAVHLEIVSSLSTDAFLMSLRRFVARRGRPKCIYSDNGTNFRGADNALGMLDWVKIQEFSNIRRIKWIFLPPASPWWGGWWERLIRMMKGILRKTLGRTILSLEELTTLVCDCEMLMNERPLTYISEDPNDLEPLTPAMFLRDLPESYMYELDLLESHSLQANLQKRQKLRKNLKKRFRSEYLSQLVQHNTKAEERKLMVGDVVIIGSEDTRRQNWPLARVEELIPGRDGHPRVARLRTSSGKTISRTLQRIYLLEGARDKKNVFAVNSPLVGIC